MVHGELIAQGKVKQLTYRQVRSLEKLDAKKARSAKWFDLAKESIHATGEVLGRTMEGNITGPILLVLALTATAPDWIPIVSAAVGNISAAAGAGFKNGAFQVPAGEYHLGGITIHVGADVPGGIAVLPKPPPPSPSQPYNTLHQVLQGPFATQWEATLNAFGNVIIFEGPAALFPGVNRYLVEQGKDGQFYVVDNQTLATS